MNRQLSSRRIALISAVVVIGLTACGQAADDASPTASSPVAATAPPLPQVIQVAGMPGGPAALPAAMDAAQGAPEAGGVGVAESRMFPALVTYVYDGPAADLTAPAASWFFDPAGRPQEEQIAALAAALGVDGDVREQESEKGGGWVVGSPEESAGPGLYVSTDPLHSWWYNAANTYVSGPDCEIYAEIEPAVEAGSLPAPDASVAPENLDAPAKPIEQGCEPVVPVNVPDGAAAEALARELFASLGLDVASYDYESYADEWGASVTGYLMIDGIRTSMAVNASFGAEGALTWAGGFLATPQRGPDYSRIGVEAAVQRLNDQNGSWMNFDTSVVRGTEIAVAEEVAPEPASGGPVEAVPGEAVPTPSLVAPVEDACLDDTGVECAPYPVGEPVTVTLRNATPSLEQLWASDDTVWLVPGYSFTTDDGGIYSVMAIEDQYIEFVQPTDVPVADDRSVGTAVCPAPTTASTAPVLGMSIADSIVGLCEGDAAELIDLMYPGSIIRAVRIDGLDQAMTEDYNEQRVNVAVEAGIVTEVVSIG